MPHKKPKKPALSELESLVMDVLWKRSGTAESVRMALAGKRSLKDSTVRTILRRLEEKGYVTHEVDGRTYVYQPVDQSHNVAAEAVRGLIDRFCSGSVEKLLVGVVENQILTPDELMALARKIAEAEEAPSTAERRPKTMRKRTD